MTTRIDLHDPAYTRDYQRLEPELAAMPADDLEPIRHDIMAAVILALGVMPNVRALRRRVRARFGEAAEASLGELDVMARALAKAHSLHLLTLHGNDVEEMAGALARLRAVLFLEVQALVARGVYPKAVLAELVGGASFKGLCLDVLQLVSLLRRTWAEVEALTGVTSSELDEAESRAHVLSTALGENEVGSVPSPAGDMRRRAYTRFVRSYDEHRRYATYFHWETEDEDDVMPPLGAGRSRRENDDEVALPPVTPGPVPAPGMPGAPAFGPSP